MRAVLTSIAAQPVAPMRCCSPEAMLGTWSSKLQVPKTMSSMSRPESPAHASARAAATCAMSAIGTWDTRRSRMPVRLVIHSSLVSSMPARSWFERTAGGRHLPQPVMAAWVVMAWQHTTPPPVAHAWSPRTSASRGRRRLFASSPGERAVESALVDEHGLPWRPYRSVRLDFWDGLRLLPGSIWLPIVAISLLGLAVYLVNEWSVSRIRIAAESVNRTLGMQNEVIAMRSQLVDLESAQRVSC